MSFSFIIYSLFKHNSQLKYIEIYQNNKNWGLRYEGEFVNGLREGNGVFYWEDGTRWEGPFKNNEMNGEGLYYDKEESFPVVYNNGEIVE